MSEKERSLLTAIGVALVDVLVFIKKTNDAPVIKDLCEKITACSEENIALMKGREYIAKQAEERRRIMQEGGDIEIKYL